MFEENHIPLDIEFDHEELLRLLVELYDLYRPHLDPPKSSNISDILLPQFHRVYDDMAAIYYCVQSRVLKGHIGPASIDEGLMNSVVARIDDYNENIESTTA
jgi:hypothetical protein